MTRGFEVASGEARIVGAAESEYTRHPAAGVSTEGLLADAYLRVLRNAGIERSAVDGLGVASFSLVPDHASTWPGGWGCGSAG